VRILVTISRDWDDYQAIEDALCTADPRTGFHKVTVVHGASHMDWFVAGVAHMLGMDLEAHPADWAKHGKAAGPIRNQEMVDAGADLCLAFIKNASPGATGCASKAEAAGIEVRRCTRSGAA
jgi:YspA, cpYpsA-related SLOG family